MIAIAKPLLGEPEAEAARKAILSGWVTQGPAVAAFEAAFAGRLGAPHACAVSNCTTALHLGLKAVGVGPGDVVLTVSHSFIATANAVRYCNAEPVFVDIDEKTLNMDPDALEVCLDEDFVERDGRLVYRHVARLGLAAESPLRLFDPVVSGRLAAIMVVHQVGMPADLLSIAAIARRYGVPLVEDAACAAGSLTSLDGGVSWRALGNPVGDVACFSFHPRKIITTGEGGMLVCADPERDRMFRLWRQHGMSVSDATRHAATDVVFEDYLTVGYNYRLSDIQAAIGLAQLDRLDGIVAQRRSIAAIYGERLADIVGVRPPVEPAHARSNWQSYVTMLDDPALQRPVIRGLMAAGISARRGIMCAHLEQPYAEAWSADSLLSSLRARDCGLILPLHHDVTEDMATMIADTLIDIVHRERGCSLVPASFGRARLEKAEGTDHDVYECGTSTGSMRLPDFILGGAPRSGTTWLYHALDRHPEIYMAKPLKPEPKFFLVDDLYSRGLEHYAKTWFPDVRPGVMAGEKSTNYLESPLAAERIGRDLPTVKLIFILRDPVERAWSNYLWSKMNGMETESFADAIRSETIRDSALPPHLRYARPFSYVSRGMYADLLEPFIRQIGSDRILCLRFEDLKHDVGALLTRLHRFLGVTERPEDGDGLGRINEAQGADEPLPPDCAAMLAEIYAEPNRRLAELVGDEFFAWRRP